MKTPRILIVDTYYPDFIKACPVDVQTDVVGSQYPFRLQEVLDRCFGTFDSYSRHLRALGWDAIDAIVNHAELQRLWAKEHQVTHTSLEFIALEQIRWAKPDVVFCQDLSFFSIAGLRELSSNYVLAGQCSCPMPNPEKVRNFDMLFTSFPHYLEPFSRMGVSAHYVPLAFNEEVLNKVRSDAMGERTESCVFVGGVGTPSHWSAGMSVLEAVARGIPIFKCWGYGYGLLPENNPVKTRFQGQAWGLEMYEILGKARIVVNRHGEVAGEYANNMRMFEATGMGALLLTEEKSNLRDFFSESEVATYRSPQEAVEKILYYLDNEGERRGMAAAGQRRTLNDHTYVQRMKTVSAVLMAAL